MPDKPNALSERIKHTTFYYWLIAIINRGRLMAGNLDTILNLSLNLIADPIMREIPIVGVLYYVIAFAIDILAFLYGPVVAMMTDNHSNQNNIERLKRSANNLVWAGINTLKFMGKVAATPILVVGYAFDFCFAAFNLTMCFYGKLISDMSGLEQTEAQKNKYALNKRKLITSGLLLVGMAALFVSPLAPVAVIIASAAACFTTRAIDSGFDYYAHKNEGKQLGYIEGVTKFFTMVRNKCSNTIANLFVWGNNGNESRATSLKSTHLGVKTARRMSSPARMQDALVCRGAHADDQTGRRDNFSSPASMTGPLRSAQGGRNSDSRSRTSSNCSSVLYRVTRAGDSIEESARPDASAEAGDVVRDEGVSASGVTPLTRRNSI